MLASLILAGVPLVIAHRGASGLRPEHTLASYELAIEQGADVIEPDLVPTKDGALVCRHENEISGTTDVADHPEFAARKTTKTIDGKPETGWFTEDFTLAELKTLRAKERLPKLRPENAKYDGQFEIPTFAEVLRLAVRHHVGVYPETKHPSYFTSVGLPLEKRLLDTMREEKVLTQDGTTIPVFIQSFEVENLKRLDEMVPKRQGVRPVTLVQLMDAKGKPADASGETYREMATTEGLKAIAGYADAIGPALNMIIPMKEDKTLGEPTTLVADAHTAGLKVHPWTFRKEDSFLPKDYAGRIEDYMRRFVALGVDGFFTDFPGIGRKIADEAK